MPPRKTIRVLVTGATGFLGSHILAALMAEAAVIPVAACRDRAGLTRHPDIEIREGDLLDARYRRTVVEGIDVVCHAAAWASMWNHATLERERFFEPTRDLIDQAIAHGVRRFIQTSTVAIGAVSRDDELLDDFSPTRHSGFWPHLDRLIDIDEFMRANSRRGTQMVTMRLGHFVGAGNRLGLVPALVPRLKTYLVPWLAGGRERVPLVADTDLGRAFTCAALAGHLDVYESFNICGPEFPTLREVIGFIASETGCPRPLYSVPYPVGHGFGWLMETLHPVLPGSSPFLTRSIVHLCQHWACSTAYAYSRLGYAPMKDWRIAVREQLAALRAEGYPWPRLSTT